MARKKVKVIDAFVTALLVDWNQERVAVSDALNNYHFDSIVDAKMLYDEVTSNFFYSIKSSYNFVRTYNTRLQYMNAKRYCDEIKNWDSASDEVKQLISTNTYMICYRFRMRQRLDLGYRPFLIFVFNGLANYDNYYVEGISVFEPDPTRELRRTLKKNIFNDLDVFFSSYDSPAPVDWSAWFNSEEADKYIEDVTCTKGEGITTQIHYSYIPEDVAQEAMLERDNEHTENPPDGY